MEPVAAFVPPSIRPLIFGRNLDSSTRHTACKPVEQASDKDEDKIRFCCVCCKIVSLENDCNFQPASGHQSPICGKVCLRVLDQTLAFVQGFVLCKMICDFLQHWTLGKRKESSVNDSVSQFDSLLSFGHRQPVTSQSQSEQKYLGSMSSRPGCSGQVGMTLDQASYDDQECADGDSDTTEDLPLTSATVAETPVVSSLHESSDPQLRTRLKKKRKTSKTASSKHKSESDAKIQRDAAKRKTGVKVRKVQGQARKGCPTLRRTFKAVPVSPEESVNEIPSFTQDEDYDLDTETVVPDVEENVSADSMQDTLVKSEPVSVGSERRKHVAESPLRCAECGKEFRLRRSLKYHLIRHHGKQEHAKKKMVCRFCGKVCIGQTGLTLHIGNRHAGEKAVECDICGEKFKTSHLLHRHRTLDHNKPHGQCHICGKNFKYAHTLKEHLRAHSGIKGFVCELCGQSFFRLSNLCDHRRRNHTGDRQRRNSDPNAPGDVSRPRGPRNLKTMQCRECLEVLDNIKAWEAHREQHRLNRSIFCPICGKGFRTQSSLYSHQKQHQEKKFQCDICSKTFTYKCNMERHRETHNTTRPHKCEFCHKTFKTQYVMNRHKVMHIEEKQYKCHICGRGLTCSDNLKKHLRVMHPGSYS